VVATRLNALKAVERGPLEAMAEFVSVQQRLSRSEDAAEGVPVPAPAPAALPDPAATSVEALGWMQGFPPAPDKLITFDNPAGGVFPRTRWSFSHVRETVPTANVWRGPGAASPLPSATPRFDIERITFKPLGSAGSDATMNFAQMISGTYTDGILVMHRGKVVYEKYFGALSPERPHIAMSVTKSFVGTLAAILADEGKLDPAAPVTQYLPELKDTAYGDATVRQVMDMTVGVHYSENYADPKAEIWDYARAGGMLTQGQNYTGPKSFYEFLVTLKKEGTHGDAFAYKTVNAEVLAWILRRASGQSLADLLSEKIWRRIGAEQDAYFMVDRIGTESGGGGLNTVLRDIARFGETLRNGGRASNGQQAIPKAVVDHQQPIEDQAFHQLELHRHVRRHLPAGAAGHEAEGLGAAVRRTCCTMRSIAPAMAKVPPLVSASLVLVGNSRTSPVGTCRPAVPLSSARSMMPWPGRMKPPRKRPSASTASTVTAVPTITTTIGRGLPSASMRWRAPIIATQRSAPSRVGWS
jgi:CubicO group peptidase (beta-lactamase class C family)